MTLQVLSSGQHSSSGTIRFCNLEHRNRSFLRTKVGDRNSKVLDLPLLHFLPRPSAPDSALLAASSYCRVAAVAVVAVAAFAIADSGSQLVELRALELGVPISSGADASAVVAVVDAVAVARAGRGSTDSFDPFAPVEVALQVYRTRHFVVETGHRGATLRSRGVYPVLDCPWHTGLYCIGPFGRAGQRVEPVLKKLCAEAILEYFELRRNLQLHRRCKLVSQGELHRILVVKCTSQSLEPLRAQRARRREASGEEGLRT